MSHNIGCELGPTGGKYAIPEETIVDYSLIEAGVEREPASMASAISMPRAELLDKHWGTAFKVIFTLTILGAACFGSDTVAAFQPNSMSGHRRAQEDSTTGGPLVLLLATLAMIMTAVVVPTTLLYCVASCFKGSIYASIAASMAVSGLPIILSVIQGNADPRVIVFWVGVGSALIWFLHRQRDRIDYAASNLKVASVAIRKMPSTICVALLLSLMQGLWILTVSFAALGFYARINRVVGADGTAYRAFDCSTVTSRNATAGTSTSSCVCNGSTVDDGSCTNTTAFFPVVFFWIFALYWGSAVIKNVVASTVAGSVASWWYTPQEKSAVRRAFCRATRSAFGSICKASLLSSFVRLITRLRCLLLRCIPCGFCCMWGMGMAQRAVDYALQYVVCFISIYGLNFDQAKDRAVALFESRGFSTLFSDCIVNHALRMFAILNSVTYVIIAAMVIGVFAASDDGGSGGARNMLAFVVALIIGMVACIRLVSTSLEVLRTGYKTVYLCHLQDPTLLRDNHGHELYAELSEAWDTMQNRDPSKC